MRRICSHLTYANVMATLAVFLVLGGGTALASYVISSNSQIGPNTISGHKPPTGAHANVIAESINGQDVAANGLRGADVLESSLTGNVQKLIYTANATNPPAPQNLGTIGPYTLKGSCIDLGSGIVRFRLYAQGPAGTAYYMYHEVPDSNPSLYQALTFKQDVTIPANTATEIARTSEVQDHYTGIAGAAILKSGSTVVEVDFNAQANSPYPQPPPSHCFLYGTATRAT